MTTYIIVKIIRALPGPIMVISVLFLASSLKGGVIWATFRSELVNIWSTVARHGLALTLEVY